MIAGLLTLSEVQTDWTAMFVSLAGIAGTLIGTIGGWFLSRKQAAAEIASLRGESTQRLNESEERFHLAQRIEDDRLIALRTAIREGAAPSRLEHLREEAAKYLEADVLFRYRHYVDLRVASTTDKRGALVKFIQFEVIAELTRFTQYIIGLNDPVLLRTIGLTEPVRIDEDATYRFKEIIPMLHPDDRRGIGAELCSVVDQLTNAHKYAGA